MSRLTVSGVPKTAKLGKLVPIFKKILSIKPNEFHMSVLHSNGPIKDLTIIFSEMVDVLSAQEKINNFIYKYNGIVYPLKATIDYGLNQNSQRSQSYKESGRQNGNKFNDGDYNRDRSRSPHYSNEAASLDLKIDLLRKQRMVLEEERKLLEEQRKLDRLKRETLGSDDTSALDIFDEIDDDGLEPSAPPAAKKPRGQLSFHQASGLLLKRLNVFVDQHSSPEERKTLLTVLRSKLKERCAAVVAADGQGVYQTHRVIKLYRTQYPPSEDEEFVKQLVKDMKEGRVPAKKPTAAPSVGAKAEAATDGTKTAGDKSALEEGKATAEDSTKSGNKTDKKEGTNEASEKRVGVFEENRLTFYKASGVLVRKMNIHMNKHCKTENRRLLVLVLRHMLKKRLAAVVGVSGIYQTHKVIKLYRQKHPDSEDEEFIKVLVKDVEEGHLPDGMTAEDLADRTRKYDNTDDNESQDDMKPEKSEGAIESDNPSLASSLVCQPDQIKDVASAPESIDKDAQNDLVKDITETLTAETDDSKVQTEAMTKENGSDSINVETVDKVEEENRGVKRKTEEDDDITVKVAKIEDGPEDCADPADNDFEDWN